MSVFSKGDKIPMDAGRDAVVISDGVLGSGGQGEVYAVRFDGSDYALKWYTSERILENKDAFIDKDLVRNKITFHLGAML